MNDKFQQDFIRASKSYVSEAALTLALESNQQYESKKTLLLAQGKLPTKGWTDAEIEEFLTFLSKMDSNNFPHNVGVGEREARIFSSLVSRRHYNLGHGVGRSGDLCASQPKATGSSILYKLATRMTLDCLREAGCPKVDSVCIIPVATGMALKLCFSVLAKHRPSTKSVIWSRCDQKSCLKAIHAAELIPLVVDGVCHNDEVVTNTKAIAELLEKGVGFRAVVTTTSCFAPRACDDIEQVAILCKTHNVPHIINNAYGVQSTKLMSRIKEAARLGRVDAFVQSTDKNFMVPVGGSIVASFNKDFSQSLSEFYPGRASISPITDLFITLLSMGRDTYKNLTKKRNHLKKYLDEKFGAVASKHGLRLFETPSNPISVAMYLPGFVSAEEATFLGSKLYIRGVTGARVVTPGKKTNVGSTHLIGWGSHCKDFPSAYLTTSASIGMTEEEVDTFCHRLDKTLSEWKRKLSLTGDEHSTMKREKSESSHLNSESSHLARESSHLARESSHLASEKSDLKSESSHLKSESSHLESESSDLKSESSHLASESSHLESESSHLEVDLEVEISHLEENGVNS